jgi:hypothetical protein
MCGYIYIYIVCAHMICINTHVHISIYTHNVLRDTHTVFVNICSHISVCVYVHVYIYVYIINIFICNF